MTTALSPALLSRLKKAADDSSFGQELPSERDWIGSASTPCALQIWLGVFGAAPFLATFSQEKLARALRLYGTSMAAPLPEGARCGRTVADDIFDGPLLAPNFHAAFDRGFIPAADDGAVIVVAAFDVDARATRGLEAPLRARARHERQGGNLPWHRGRALESGADHG